MHQIADKASVLRAEMACTPVPPTLNETEDTVAVALLMPMSTINRGLLPETVMLEEVKLLPVALPETVVPP